MDYAAFHKLWDEYGQAEQSHNCAAEADFGVCEVCTASQEAAARLQFGFRHLARLLERYHDHLKELVDAVIQEVPFPREERLQVAMLKALNVLNKERVLQHGIPDTE